MFRCIVATALACWGLSNVVAHADDWTADKLRGQVLQLIDNQWQPLSRGMIVPDSRVIRTLHSGRVTLVRGNETVDVGPDTQIQIYDKAGRKPFTTVKEYFGSVGVEAEVEQVQHFAVQTPYLAAVVKGTRFTVTSGAAGASVNVRRGHVLVEDKHTDTHVTLSVGQSASVGAGGDGALKVSGSGDLPVLLDAAGEPLDAGSTKADLKAAAKQAKQALKVAEKDAKQAETDATSGGSSGSSGPGPSESAASGSGKGKKS
ncbi:MAG TPA: FecR domain-containing protein [Devosia sp.]|jgi:hypothetical protein|nr:FecR domain-containing protein [Devosia sp.]